MKVTRLRLKHVKLPLPKPIPSARNWIHSIDCALVFLDTDEGVVGEGLALTLNGQRLAVISEMIRSLEPLVVGAVPENGGEFWLRAWRDISFVGKTGVAVMGLAAIDMALWDLRGKSAGLNVGRLIGLCREKVPVYRSNGLRLSASIDELQAEAAGFLDQGFRAMKMSLGMPTAADDVARVKAVREAIGYDAVLMADCNQQFSVSEAMRRGRLLEEFQLAWIEEPVSAQDHEGEARVAGALRTPVASGENAYTRYEVMDMMARRSVGILMPDLQRMGGPTELLKVAHIADGFNVPVTPHLFSEAGLCLAGAISNAIYAEYVVWLEPLYGWRIELDSAGAAEVSRAPGWGLSFDADALRRFGI